MKYKDKDQFIQDAAPVIMAALIIVDNLLYTAKGLRGTSYADMADEAADAAEILADNVCFDEIEEEPTK